jgi:hypothetical protein
MPMGLGLALSLGLGPRGKANSPVNPLLADNSFTLPFTEGTGTVAYDLYSSGNNANFYPSAGYYPSWISGGGLSFNGSILELPVAAWPACEWTYFLLDIQPYSTYQQNEIPCLISNDNGDYSWFNYADGSVYGLSGGSSLVGGVGIGSASTVQGINGVMLVNDFANGVVRIFINGKEVPYKQGTYSMPSRTAPANWWLGFLAGVGFPYIGDVFWCAAGQTASLAITNALKYHQFVISQASVKAGLVTAGKTVGNTQAISGNPYFIFDGDSLTGLTASANTGGKQFVYGYDRATVSIAAFGAADSVIYPYADVAIGGQTSAEILAAFPTRVAPIIAAVLAAGASAVYYNLKSGTNDLLHTALTPSQIETNNESILTLAKNAGATRRFYNSVLPCGSGEEAYRQTVNGFVTEIQAPPALWRVPVSPNGNDVGSDAWMGQAGQNADTEFYAGDGVHPLLLGVQIEAGYDAYGMATTIPASNLNALSGHPSPTPSSVVLSGTTLTVTWTKSGLTDTCYVFDTTGTAFVAVGSPQTGTGTATATFTVTGGLTYNAAIQTSEYGIAWDGTMVSSDPANEVFTQASLPVYNGSQYIYAAV